MDKLDKAKKALYKRLVRERKTYGLVGLVKTIDGESAPYNGKGERFELQVEFVGGEIKDYEVTVYGNGRSFKIYEL